MKFRDSFSRLKQKLAGRKPKPDKTWTNAGGARLDPTGLRSRSEPDLLVGSGYDREGNEVNSDGGQVHSAIQLPRLNELESVLADESVTDST